MSNRAIRQRAPDFKRGRANAAEMPDGILRSLPKVFILRKVARCSTRTLLAFLSDET